MMKMEFHTGRSGTKMSDFQSESKKSGDKFEELVYEDLIKLHYFNIQKNVDVPEVGIQVDFMGENYHYVEAKGGVEGDRKRPGAKRTDNVKKAIANGALLKKAKPNSYYVVYFSSRPYKDSSSDRMINAALKYKIIDEVRYIEYDDLNLTLLLFEDHYPLDNMGWDGIE